VLINGVNFSGDKIEDFCRRHGVTKLSLFGSILRELGAESGHGFRLTGDVDVLVEFLPEKVPSLLVFAGLQMELSTLVSAKFNSARCRCSRDSSFTRCCARRGCCVPRDPSQGGPNDRERQEHMLNAAMNVLLFVTNRTRYDLDADPRLRRAMVDALQTTGEAAARRQGTWRR